MKASYPMMLKEQRSTATLRLPCRSFQWDGFRLQQSLWPSSVIARGIEAARSESRALSVWKPQAEGRGRFSTGTSSPKPTPQVVKRHRFRLSNLYSSDLMHLVFDAGTADKHCASFSYVLLP